MRRWDSQEEATMDNLVLLTFEEAERHDTSNLTEIEEQDPMFFQHVQHILKALNLHYM